MDQGRQSFFALKSRSLLLVANPEDFVKVELTFNDKISELWRHGMDFEQEACRKFSSLMWVTEAIQELV